VILMVCMSYRILLLYDSLCNFHPQTQTNLHCPRWQSKITSTIRSKHVACFMASCSAQQKKQNFLDPISLCLYHSLFGMVHNGFEPT
jgi:hypothetical protein